MSNTCAHLKRLSWGTNLPWCSTAPWCSIITVYSKGEMKITQKCLTQSLFVKVSCKRELLTRQINTNSIDCLWLWCMKDEREEEELKGTVWGRKYQRSAMTQSWKTVWEVWKSNCYWANAEHNPRCIRHCWLGYDKPRWDRDAPRPVVQVTFKQLIWKN